jgi:hypothetical protein
LKRRIWSGGEDFRDYGQVVYESLRVLAYAEHRSVEEVSADITYGAADTVAARLVPDAPVTIISALAL